MSVELVELKSAIERQQLESLIASPTVLEKCTTPAHLSDCGRLVTFVLCSYRCRANNSVSTECSGVSC
jgi:hypothetical protein